MSIGAQIAWDDTILPFQLDKSDVRGRVARLDGVLEETKAGEDSSKRDKTMVVLVVESRAATTSVPCKLAALSAF